MIYLYILNRILERLDEESEVGLFGYYCQYVWRNSDSCMVFVKRYSICVVGLLCICSPSLIVEL